MTSMTAVGISAGAVYLPACAVPTRKGQRRVCAADEDAVTLAVDAGVRALAHWGGDEQSIGALVVALRQGGAGPDVGVNSQLVREALGLPATIRVVSMSSSDDLGGLAAIQSALEAVAAGAVSSALVIAADAAGTEHVQAGAAAVVVSSRADDELVVLTELGRASGLTHEQWDFDGREPDFRFIQHRNQELADRVLSGGARPTSSVSRLFVAGGSPRERSGVLSALLGADADESSTASGGADVGVAGPLVAIVDAAAHRPDGGTGALYASGSGQVVLCTILVPDGVSRRFGWMTPASYCPPAKLSGSEPELSLPLESPFYVRNWGPTLRLDAARCASCGHTAFPPTQRAICPDCRSTEWLSYRLPRDGHVYSYLENNFLPAGFPKSLMYVLAELSDGFKYWAPMPPETSRVDVRIGDPVRLALRRFTLRDGIAAYGMKFVRTADDSIELPAQPKTTRTLAETR